MLCSFSQHSGALQVCIVLFYSSCISSAYGINTSKKIWSFEVNSETNFYLTYQFTIIQLRYIPTEDPFFKYFLEIFGVSNLDYVCFCGIWVFVVLQHVGLQCLLRVVALELKVHSSQDVLNSAMYSCLCRMRILCHFWGGSVFTFKASRIWLPSSSRPDSYKDYYHQQQKEQQRLIGFFSSSWCCY